MKRFAYGVVVLLAAGGWGPARAGTVTADAIIDLNAAITGNQWTGFAHALNSTVRVQSGDTVVINIGFLPGQALSWESNGFFDPWLMLQGYPGGVDGNQAGGFSWSDTSVVFTGLTQGTQLPAGQLVGGSSGSIHLGPTFTLGNDNVARTFTGVTVSFVATFDDGDPFRDYGTIGYDVFPLFDGDVSVSGVSAVPEPGSMSLLALGAAGMIGYHVRRRKAAAV